MHSDQISTSATISVFLPALAGGGAERAMIHLAQGFAARGFKADLVVAQVEGAYAAKLPPEIHLVDLQAKFPVVVSKTFALRRYLRETQPAFLVTTLDIANAAAWAKRLAGVPTQVVMCVQTHLSQQFQDRAGGVGLIRPHLVRWFYPWSDRIVAASQGVADDLSTLSGIPRETIRVIYNPVVMPSLFERMQAPVEHPWFEEGEPPVILGVGRLVKQKDFLTLVQAFAQVRQQRPARLMILGEPDPREPQIKPELEATIQELGMSADVALPGFVDNPYAYMSKAAVFVLSSIYEGFGNVVAEAIATGTSVVSTDCESGPAEILAHGKYGKLVPVKNVNALAHEILATLDQPTDPTLLQQRAQAFTIEAIADQYLEVFRDLDRSECLQIAS